MRRPQCDDMTWAVKEPGPFYVAALQTSTLVGCLARHSERICGGLPGLASVAAQTTLFGFGQAIKLIVIHLRHIRGVGSGRSIAHAGSRDRGLGH